MTIIVFLFVLISTDSIQNSLRTRVDRCRRIARNNNLISVPAGMELIPELKMIDLKGNPFDDGAKVSTVRRFGEDVKIKLD